MEKVIADSGFVVALVNSSDDRHPDVKPIYQQYSRMAISERLNITTVLTIDQRDFRLFKPLHCQSFTLQP
ncbi:MAG: hypothetical protein WA885_13910 [Phormidesmis sp.]